MQFLGPVALPALRHRPVQAVALALLALVATALSTLAPLYSANMADSITRLDVEHAEPMTTALQVISQPATDLGTGEVANAADPARLAAATPRSLRRLYQAPVLSRYAHADNATYRLTGQIVWRDGACGHVTIVSGRCPRHRDEIMVSRPDLRLPGIHLGRSIEISGVTVQSGAPATVSLHVVGVYRVSPTRFWELADPVGKSGSPGSTGISHDDWFTAEGTFLDAAHPLPGTTSAAVFPLDPDAIHVDTFLALPGRIARLNTRIHHLALATATASSDVSTLSDDVRGQRAQADRTVPLLMLQVVLLTLVVFWQVLAAAADQRRGDVALSRLRGRGRRATTRSLMRELLPVVEAGVLAGGLAGLGASLLARASLLPASSFVLPWTFWAAFAAAAVVIAALTHLTARSLAREPVDRLLRQVPARHRWRWTTLDTVLLTLAAGGTVAFAAGGLGRDFALAGPALVALLAGLLLSHVITPVAATVGNRALLRGRLVPALAALEAARRPGARRTVTMVTLAAAFLVFFANAWAIGNSNRQSVAEQVIGAPTVLTLSTTSLAPVRAALSQADPTGTTATPVVVVRPLGSSTAPSTLAVDPDHFPAIALLGQHARNLPWTRLEPDTGPPLRITGRQAALTARTSNQPSSAQRVTLKLTVLEHDGTSKVTVPLGTLRHGATTTLHAQVPCARSCTLLSLTVSSTPGLDWAGRIRLGAIRTGGDTVPWGRATRSEWHTVAGSGLTATTRSSGALELKVSTGGTSSLTVTSPWLVTTLPAFTVGLTSPPAKGKDVLLGLDRRLHPVDVVTAAPRIPTAPEHALVASIDGLSRAAAVDPADQVQVWLANSTTTLEHRVTRALQESGVDVTEVRTVHDQRRAYDDSVAAWSLSLALVVGAITLLITLLAMVVLAVTGWRATARDLAALQLNGIDYHRLRRASTLAQVATITTAVLVGALTGILASWLAIDQVPLFAHQPPLTTLDLTPSWTTIAVTTAVVLVVLLAAAALLVHRVAARAGSDRLREHT